MPELVIEPGESLSYEFSPPSRDGAACFVFVNPLLATPMTPGGGIWDETAQGLIADGYGALAYDFRGLNRSRAAVETELDPSLLVADLRRLTAHALGAPPIFVGLGFGGLIAAGAVLDGEPASGLVMINGLIDVGERLAWVAQALGLLAAEGGAALQMDALLPLLAHPDYLEKAKASSDHPPEYERLPERSALINLYRNAAESEWALPLEQLSLPTLVISGLQDRVFLDREVVNRNFARLPDARAEAWEDAGHLLPAERPEQLTRSLARFAREIASEPATP